LEDLDLYGVKVTDSGIEHLRKLKKLRRLNLLGAQISDASAGILSGLEELRELNLYRSRITNAGLAKLHRLRNLQLIDLRYTGVTGAGVDALRAALPSVRVTFVDTAPPVPTSRVVPPRGRGPQAIAQWVQAMGGIVRRGDKGIQYISLVRTRVTDAEVKYLAAVPGLE
jgi:hypothetical protein